MQVDAGQISAGLSLLVGQQQNQHVTISSNPGHADNVQQQILATFLFSPKG
jgi:hypothetical protein